MPKPLAIYVRVSRRGDREDDRYHSPSEQEARARAHASARGYATDGVFFDEDVSGGTHPTDRPAMARLLDAVRSREVGGIVAYSLDRLSRDPGHGDWLIREVTKHGGIVAAPDMPEDITSPTGEFTFGMLLGVARLYRRQAGARFDSAKEAATLAGIPVGPVPVGYRQQRDRTLEVDPATAPAIRELFVRRSRGDGLTPLAEYLAGQTGRRWTKQGVSAILANPLYRTGRLQYGDVTADVEAGTIVDDPTWYAAQNPNPTPRRPRNPDAKWLLTGIARCAGCGHSLAPWTGSSKQGSNRRYRCPNRQCDVRASASADDLESIAVGYLFEHAEVLARAASDRPDLTDLEEQLDDAERRLAQATSPDAQDALGDAWTSTIRQRRAARDAAAEALGKARAKAGIDTDPITLPREVWNSLDTATRRQTLGRFFGLIGVAGTGRDAQVEFVPADRVAGRVTPDVARSILAG
jgi:DNA invertase Pin-like site-specific DNA recombinase